MAEEKNLYEIIEKVMKKRSSEQFTAATLYDTAEVRNNAASQTRVSDYLGNLWRKGTIVRLPNTGADQSRSLYAYQWKGTATPRPADPSQAIEFKGRKVIMERPEVTISERGNEIVVETNSLVFIVRIK